MSFDFEGWKANLVNIPTDKLQDAWMAVRAEQKAREAKAIAGDQMIGMIQQLRENGALDAPVTDAESPEEFSEWVDPGTDQTRMPLKGDRFYRNQRVWESLVDFNSWEPGLPENHAAWRDVTDQLFPPEADAAPIPYEDNKHYSAGTLVEYDGANYMCINDHFAAQGWTPVNAHANWQKQGE